MLSVSPSIAREAIAAVEWTADGARLDQLARSWAQDQLAPEDSIRMAIDGSIVLAAQDYDLPQLAAALRRAARTNSVTPTVHAGADFLARQSLVDGAIGAGWLGHARSIADADAMTSARATAALANCLVELGERLTPNRGHLA